MKVFVHIGIHKTASTYFQQELFPKLKGVVFIPRRACREFNEYITDAETFEPEKARVLWERLLRGYQKDLNKQLPVLISNEDYYPHPYEGAIKEYRTLRRFLMLFGDNVYIFGFIRQQDKMLPSLYLQYVKTGGTQSFNDFFGEKPEKPFLLSPTYFFYDRLVSFLFSNFSKEKVRIFLYEEFLKNRDKVLQEIIDFLELTSDVESLRNVEHRILNISLDARYVNPVRFLNRFSKSYRSTNKLFPFSFYKLYMKYFLGKSQNRQRSNDSLFCFPDEVKRDIIKSNNRLQELMPELNLAQYKYRTGVNETVLN